MKNKCYDHLGNGFDSQREMCEHWNVEARIYRARLRYGWSKEEALLIKGRVIYGNTNLFQFKNETYYNWLCPVCKHRHILSAPEIRQHYLKHIKNGEVEG